MKMKITIEKAEWQLLGQLSEFVMSGKHHKGLVLQAMILLEFRVDNSEAFILPQRRKRKLKKSTVLALYQYLSKEHWAYDAYWDMVLSNLREKLYKALVPTNLLKDETPY